MDKASPQDWTLETAVSTYRVAGWGRGYFDISTDGDVEVCLGEPDRDQAVSMMDIVSGLEERGFSMPVLLRFRDILASRIAHLHDSFRRAMDEADYHGEYRGVYPIKVNQQQQVVEEIATFGREYNHGFEAGSKAELIAALAYLNDPEAYLICNGFKDEEFVDLALYALKMNIQTILVLEMPSELELILRRAEALGIRPRLGVRAKLATQVETYWSHSSGDKSTFGLNAAEIIDVIDVLKEKSQLDCLHMLHFHLGSQVTNIRDVRMAAAEAARFYQHLLREGAPMGIFDIGGGLAVDYDGTHSNSPNSSNYRTEEYAADIIEIVRNMAEEEGVSHPVIISESGRATVAHHSVLLFNILNVTQLESSGLPSTLPEGAHELLRNLLEVNADLNDDNLQEFFHDAHYYRDEIRSGFNHGTISLRDRAMGERISGHIISRIRSAVKNLADVPPEMEKLESDSADVYHGNFSLFQSLPDSWAIDQLFPIMPIHRLNEQPTRKAILSDITCDCDGRIDGFIDRYKTAATLNVHELNGEDYYVGVFLVGAYQETLGDLHNLLGDTNVVSIRLNDDGIIEYDREIHGDTVADVLSYVEYRPLEMIDHFRRTAEKAVRDGRISPRERRDIMTAYQEGMQGYTYFES